MTHYSTHFQNSLAEFSGKNRAGAGHFLVTGLIRRGSEYRTQEPRRRALDWEDRSRTDNLRLKLAPRRPALVCEGIADEDNTFQQFLVGLVEIAEKDGASTGQVIRMVMREAAILLIAGVPIGTVMSLIASRAAESLLFGVKSDDLVTLPTAASLLALSGLMASLLPAHRASRLTRTPPSSVTNR